MTSRGSDALRRALRRVLAHEVLSEGEMEDAMEAVLAGEATPVQVAGLAIALRMRGESIGELTAAARVLRRRCTGVSIPGELLFDTCGTGGDGASTFNISTATAIVVAACGVPVAKHGNRAVSSKAGSADVLEVLGVDLNLPKDRLEAQLQSLGIAFFFAPHHHAALRHAANARRELGERTFFNLLGPLANPAGATHQLVGVYDPARLRDMASVLGALGAARAWVVHGEGGLDELSTAGPSQVAEWTGESVREFTLRPADFGLPEHELSALAGGDAAENANIIRALLEGAPGAPRDAVLLNSAAALCVAGLASSPKEGALRAAEAIDSGAANILLKRWTS